MESQPAIGRNGNLEHSVASQALLQLGREGRGVGDMLQQLLGVDEVEGDALNVRQDSVAPREFHPARIEVETVGAAAEAPGDPGPSPKTHSIIERQERGQWLSEERRCRHDLVAVA